MYNKILEVINKWDPANLMSHAPDDEYDFEIQQIIEVIQKDQDLVVIAKAIEYIFNQTFGDDVKYEFEEYIKISLEILNKFNN